MSAQSANAPASGIYKLSPPHGAITDDNHGGLVVITSWIMMCFFVVCVSARLATRYVYVMAGGIDDVLIGVAMLFGIAQTAVIHRSASTGLGQHQDTLSDAAFGVYARSFHEGTILFVATILFSKLSTVFLLTRLTPKHNIRRACQIIGALMVMWAFSSFLGLAFQCQLPRPWDYRQSSSHQCPVNIAALNYSIMVFDILTDVVCIILPITVLWDLQMDTNRRWNLIGAFCCRFSVCICSAIRISALTTYYHSADKSWEAVAPQKWAQILQCLSIISACIPSLKVFLGSLDSGFMDLSMRMHAGPTYSGAYARGSKHDRAKHSASVTTGKSFALASYSKEAEIDDSFEEGDPGSTSTNGTDRACSDAESTRHLRRQSSDLEASQLSGRITVTKELHVHEIHDKASKGAQVKFTAK